MGGGETFNASTVVRPKSRSSTHGSYDEKRDIRYHQLDPATVLRQRAQEIDRIVLARQRRAPTTHAPLKDTVMSAISGLRTRLAQRRLQTTMHRMLLEADPGVRAEVMAMAMAQRDPAWS